MTVRVMGSSATSASAAVEEVLDQAGDLSITFLLWFASPRMGPAQIAKAFGARLPNVACIGCTSAGELLGPKMLKGSLVALVADASSVRSAHAELIEDVQSEESTRAALDRLARSAGFESPAHLDPEKLLRRVLRGSHQPNLHDGAVGIKSASKATGSRVWISIPLASLGECPA